MKKVENILPRKYSLTKISLIVWLDADMMAVILLVLELALE
jgi:hypothetical protein